VPQKQNALHFSYFYWYSISGFLGRGDLSGFVQLPEVRHPTCLLKQCSVELKKKKIHKVHKGLEFMKGQTFLDQFWDVLEDDLERNLKSIYDY
jgi:hypothetical protein